jgi:hypothetical protein
MPVKVKEPNVLWDDVLREVPADRCGAMLGLPVAAELKATRGEVESPTLVAPGGRGRQRFGASPLAQSEVRIPKASPAAATNRTGLANGDSIAVDAIVPADCVALVDVMVPTPVIAVDRPSEASHLSAVLSARSRFKPARPDNFVPNSELNPAAPQPSAPQPNAPGVNQVAADFFAFDPSRAYPNAPTARPFAGGSHQLPIRNGIRGANSWRFRIGIMICPAIGIALSWPVGMGGLPSWLWIAIAGCMLVGAVSPIVLLHRAWACIDDGSARSSPGRAVGLLLVPIFNVYWVFHVVPGYATDFNCFIERHQIEARRLSKNLILSALVPLIGIVFCWGAIAAICESINCVRRSLELEIDVKV